MPTVSSLAKLVVAASLLTACGEADLPIDRTDQPTRIVSLDFCADQYVLKLADRAHILALSPDATASFSYLRADAEGLPQVRPVAEDALMLQPDLIVRSYGGGPGAAEVFARAGIPVLQIGWAGDLDGIRRVTREVGTGLGAEGSADQVLAEMEARLAALSETGDGASLLYLTVSGTTTGTGSLIDDLIRAAGLTNYETRPGWRTLPLEQLVGLQPDLLATAFLDDAPSQKDRWNVMRHPVAQDSLGGLDAVPFDSAWVSCGGWFALDALEAMDRAAAVRAAEL